jgi:hypothetical protein
MNRDEQKRILEFIELAVKGQPGTQLAPMDVEADAIIRALFVRNPEAAYRITMLAMLQAKALAERHADPSSTLAPKDERATGLLGWLLSRRLGTDEAPDRQPAGLDSPIRRGGVA